MSKKFFIGIGGTGSRVCEALVHLCAAGFGPEELTLIIVDPDKGNGNLNRMKKLVNLYSTLKQDLHLPPEIPLFKTRINLPENFVWHIFNENQNEPKTLEYYINLPNLKNKNSSLAHLANLLFSEEELKTELHEGFRGHPSIGAVVMSNLSDSQQPWQALFQEMSNMGQNEIKVFLVGSIFGGTGASGIPTLAAKSQIKFHPKATINAEKGESKVYLGGALVLPYFSIEDGEDPEGKMFVSNGDFPIATRAALQYYALKDLAFDCLYLIGDSLTQKVGKFSPGSIKQENLPHYIELVTALASFDFFSKQEIREDKPYYISARESTQVLWDSLPVTSNQGQISPLQQKLKRNLVTLSTFAFTMLTYGQYARNNIEKIETSTWYRDNFREARESDKVNIKSAKNNKVLSDVENYAKMYLDWISAIDKTGNDQVNLINSAAIKIEFNPQAPDNTIIHSLIKSEKSKQKPLSRFITFLNKRKIKNQTLTGAERFIQLFYEASEEFCKDNYDKF